MISRGGLSPGEKNNIEVKKYVFFFIYTQASNIARHIYLHCSIYLHHGFHTGVFLLGGGGMFMKLT